MNGNHWLHGIVNWAQSNVDSGKTSFLSSLPSLRSNQSEISIQHQQLRCSSAGRQAVERMLSCSHLAKVADAVLCSDLLSILFFSCLVYHSIYCFHISIGTAKIFPPTGILFTRHSLHVSPVGLPVKEFAIQKICVAYWLWLQQKNQESGLLAIIYGVSWHFCHKWRTQWVAFWGSSHWHLLPAALWSPQEAHSPRWHGGFHGAEVRPTDLHSKHVRLSGDEISWCITNTSG